MHALAVVLLLAVLLDKFPPVASVGSLKLTDALLETLDLNGQLPRRSEEKFHVPRYIMALYSIKARTGRLRNNDREIIRTFFREGQQAHLEGHHYFRFDISAIKPQEKLKRAELRIFRRKPKSVDEPRGRFLVSVALLKRRWSPKNADVIYQTSMQVLTSKVVQNKRKGEWIIFDVLSFVKNWKREPESNFGLVVSIHGMGVNSSLFEMGEKRHREPFLVTFSEKKEKAASRSKDKILLSGAGTITSNETRSVRRSARSLQDYCKRRPFRVEFHKLGWEKWIISPRSYSAHYCSGQCPPMLYENFNPSNHAILQNILHHRVDSSIPCASCVPTKLHSISVLYKKGKIIELKTMGSMVVATCGCR